MHLTRHIHGSAGNHSLQNIPNQVNGEKKKEEEKTGRNEMSSSMYHPRRRRKNHSIITKERSGVSRGRIWASKDRQATLPQGSKVLRLSSCQCSLASVVVVVTSGRKK